MSEKIHKISESSPDLIKKLDKDKKFKFECEVCDNRIRLGLKEVNSPNYFENFFTKDELIQKNPIFNQCNDLNEIQNHLIYLFPTKKTTLEYAENKENINITFIFGVISGTTEVIFELEKKNN